MGQANSKKTSRFFLSTSIYERKEKTKNQSIMFDKKTTNITVV
jgi:hypothetical protein